MLYVVGGLYGNPLALTEIERLFEIEQQAYSAQSCAMVFNGDFHWFDADADMFANIHRRTESHHRLRGNVETELAREDDASAGCGCAYPESVPDQEVDWSNQIISLLAQAGTSAIGPDGMRDLRLLPMTSRWRVEDIQIAVTHGDHESLAGWSFAQDRLSETWDRGLAKKMAQWGVDVFASSHTCLPVADCIEHRQLPRVVINNGAAGMANASGQPHGIITRIAPLNGPPSPVEPLYSAPVRGCLVSALPVNFDLAVWQRQFLAIWPAGTAAHAAYLNRIMSGPSYSLAQAARGHFKSAVLA